MKLASLLRWGSVGLAMCGIFIAILWAAGAVDPQALLVIGLCLVVIAVAVVTLVLGRIAGTLARLDRLIVGMATAEVESARFEQIVRSERIANRELIDGAVQLLLGRLARLEVAVDELSGAADPPLEPTD